MKINVKHVSAVGVCLVISFWICLWFHLSSGLTLLHLKKKKKKCPLLIVKPASFAGVPCSCRQRGNGLCFSFPFLWFCMGT